MEKIKLEENNINNEKSKEETNIKEKKKCKTLKELEEQIDYKYNEKGELVHKITGEKVGRLGKEEYELVGSYVEKYIEHYLIQNFHLIKHNVKF